MFKVICMFLISLCGCLATAAEVTSCPQGQYLVKAHNRSAYTRTDGTHVNASYVQAYCKQHSQSSLYLIDHLKNELPQGWPHRQEKIRKWTESDVQKLIDALEEVPDFLLTQNLKGFYRFSKSKYYPNPAVSSEDIIALYDTAFQAPKNLGQILVHELAHINFKELKQKDQLDYGHATGWRYNIGDDNKLYLEGRKSGYIAEDGKISVEEDYANNLEHFLYSPDKLKKVTPEAFDWFKKRHKELKLKERKK